MKNVAVHTSITRLSHINKKHNKMHSFKLLFLAFLICLAGHDSAHSCVPLPSQNFFVNHRLQTMTQVARSVINLDYHGSFESLKQCRCETDDFKQLTVLQGLMERSSVSKIDRIIQNNVNFCLSRILQFYDSEFRGNKILNVHFD